VQLGNLATNAAASATGQVLTVQQQEQQANAQRQQETNLANAGFDQAAQTTNAANVLAGRTADAANYLATLGLDQRAAEEARAAFLSYLNIQENDLVRMDNQAQSSLTLALNAFLQQYATLGQIGKIDVGQTSASSTSGAREGAGGGATQTAGTATTGAAGASG
jgi:hypothetical protein